MRKLILALFILVIAGVNLEGQSADYRFKNFSNKEGLSQNTVTSIHQDKNGKMWFATRNGLNSFDGSQFKIYRHDGENSNSLIHNNVTALEEDTEGNLWIGTYRGINKYNPLKEQFTEYLHYSPDSSISFITILCVLEIDNEIWFGTSNGLSIFDKKTQTFSGIRSIVGDRESLSNNRIRKILQTKNGDIWLGTEQGLNRVKERTEKEITFQHFGVDSENISNSWFIQDLIEDEKGNLWIGSKSTGLILLESSSDKLTYISKTNKFKDVSKNIRALNIDLDNNLWIGTFSGLSILHHDGILENLDINNQQHSYLIKSRCLFLDQKGSMWVGTYHGGVSLWDPSFNSFINLDQNNSQNGLSYHVISSIVSDDEDHIFLGTQGGGVTIFNVTSRRTEFFDRDDRLGLANIVVKSLLYSHKNELWIGTLNEGIIVVDVEHERIIRNIISDELQSLLIQTDVHSINEENDHIIWIGTYGNGLIRYDRQLKTHQIFDVNSKVIRVMNDRVRSLLVDSSNRLWIGTQKGLSVITLNELGEVSIGEKRFFYDDQSKAGYEILSIYEDESHTIWIGTYQNGLQRFNGTSFDPITIEHTGESVYLVSSILEDEMNNLWLQTNQGIVKLDPNSNSSIVFDQTNATITSEFNTSSAYNFKNNYFFIGGASGVTYFDPKHIILNSHVPDVIFTNLKIKNVLVKPDDGNRILDQSITATDKIILPYNKANFTIQFAIPNFINSEDNQYAYRLKGLEEEFKITNLNEANYIIQNPGKYVFEVKGSNNDGAWNEEYTTLEIVVKPAPWRSPFAFVLYALLIIFSLLGLIRFMNTRTALEHKLELEHLENERKEEINKTKLQFFTNISHEFRTPLTLILAPLEQLLEEYKGSHIMYEKLLVLESNAKHLLRLINRLMDFRKLENKQFNLEASEGNIIELLKNVYLSFTEFAKEGNYEYTFKSNNETLDVYYDKTKLVQVFYNLISNAFRFTPKGGSVHVELVAGENQVYINIIDSGIGIPKEHMHKIFERFYEIPMRHTANENYNKGTGIGLSIVSNIVKLHKGKIEVKNNKSQGSIFKVTLSLGKNHLTQDEIIVKKESTEEVEHYNSRFTEPVSELTKNIEDLIANENRPSILIVEDNTPLRLFIRTLLKNDYNVIEAENGKIGLENAIKFSPDLIISDVVMPELEGTELCARIKADIRTSHIPVILLTSRTSMIYKFEGLEKGADDYISKPFVIREFKLKIKNTLDSVQRLRLKFSSDNSLMPKDIVITSVDEEALKRAFQIVEENIGNDQFDTKAFCKELGVSRTMLFTKIKAWTNFTPNEFIIEIKMKRAVQLLEQNKISISEICYHVGYQDPKYFRRIFKKKYGVSPSQYKMKFLEDIS